MSIRPRLKPIERRLVPLLALACVGCGGQGDVTTSSDDSVMTIGTTIEDVGAPPPGDVLTDTSEQDTVAPMADSEVAGPEGETSSDDAPASPQDSTSPSDVVGSDAAEIAVPDTVDQDDYTQATALFGLDVLHTVHITLGEDEVNDLWDQPYEWVVGDVVVDGEVHEQIGVRLKGKLGSFRDLDGKAAFLLKFNHSEAGNDLMGVEKLALNNLVQDPSLVHELLAYTLFRAVGIPAPRIGYARVLVNWELYGLYLMVESPNNEHFLDHWFDGHDHGSLYEGEYGQDLYVDAIPGFDHDEGTETDKMDLYDLVQALDWMDMDGDVPAQLAALFDFDAYLAFAATEIAIGHWDGYAWTRNNYYLYQPTPALPWTFMPWGTDQTFQDHLQPFGGEGRIEQMCLASPACRQLLGDAFLTTLDHMADLQLGSLALAAHALAWEAALEDPRREYDEAAMANALGDTISFLSLRPASIHDGLACLDPEYGDEDGDGYSSCFGLDCDDGDANAFPGADEVCNFKDDDCDGQVDEVEEGVESCPICETIYEDELGVVLLCRIARVYWSAHNACLERGADLVSIHSQEQQDAIAAAAYAVYSGHLWIGLDDLDEEGTFAWTDGSPVDYENWNDNEPNDWGSGEDCAHLYEGNGNKWNDLPCHHEAGYLCRVPNISPP